MLKTYVFLTKLLKIAGKIKNLLINQLFILNKINIKDKKYVCENLTRYGLKSLVIHRKDEELFVFAFLFLKKQRNPLFFLNR
ncbi:MAG: hypothetical protein IJN13_06540 [Bacilli bacterium]|nr:hypothetical protein [Bacilli bacterium]